MNPLTQAEIERIETNGRLKAIAIDVKRVVFGVADPFVAKIARAYGDAVENGQPIPSSAELLKSMATAIDTAVTEFLK